MLRTGCRAALRVPKRATRISGEVVERSRGQEIREPALDLKSDQMTAKTATKRSKPLVKKVIACISPCGSHGAAQAKATASRALTPAVHQLHRGRRTLASSCKSSPV